MDQLPVAVVLAGGRARRMQGRDKPLQTLRAKPLIAYTLDILRPHVAEIVLSVNHNRDCYQAFGFPCIPDVKFPNSSPLVGIYSAMTWYLDNREQSPKYLLCVPADVPVFPETIVRQLQQAVCAQSNAGNSACAFLDVEGQAQPLFSIWSLSLVSRLKKEIEAGNLGVHYLLNKLQAMPIDVTRRNQVDFANINTAEELATLEAALT